jgi:hypothetical protein
MMRAQRPPMAVIGFLGAPAAWPIGTPLQQ